MSKTNIMAGSVRKDVSHILKRDGITKDEIRLAKCHHRRTQELRCMQQGTDGRLRISMPHIISF